MRHIFLNYVRQNPTNFLQPKAPQELKIQTSSGLMAT